MRSRFILFVLALFGAATLPSFAQSTSKLVVRFDTNLGNIDVQLFPGDAPKTVANFLRYVNSGRYFDTLFHRSVPGFVIQGGGFFPSSPNFDPISLFPAIPGEALPPPNTVNSNTRGTIAMALSAGPGTATSQWFFNESDNNAAILDGTTPDGGPFTVFGKVANSASLAVMDQIAAVPVPSPSPFSAPFNQIPLINYVPANGVTGANLVLLYFVTQLNPPLFFQNGTSLGTLTLDTTLLPNAWQGVGAVASGWQERAIADVNGDGISDIIFQNGTEVAALILDASGNPASWLGIGTMSSGWELRAAADINADGRPELIFQNGTLLGYLTRNSAGAPVAWNGIGAMGAGWELRAVADLNLDGKPDLIFQNGTSIGALQLGTNGLPTAWNGIGTLNAGWTLAAAADLNADAHPELVFQNGTLLGALSVNTSFAPTAWQGIGAMGTGWTLPGDY
jgi:cyclophilin family peptidyl-prolyl cis-trans isomerase